MEHIPAWRGLSMAMQLGPVGWSVLVVLALGCGGGDSSERSPEQENGSGDHTVLTETGAEEQTLGEAPAAEAAVPEDPAVPEAAVPENPVAEDPAVAEANAVAEVDAVAEDDAAAVDRSVADASRSIDEDAPVAETRGDLDGDGEVEAVAFFGDGLLRIGPHELRLQVRQNPAHAEGDRPRTVEVVRLDRRRNLLLLRLPLQPDEDSPDRLVVVAAHRGTYAVAFEITDGRAPLRFPGDGTIRVLETHHGACERAGFPERVQPEEAVLRLGRDGRFVERRRRPVGRRLLCSEIPACPYVYVIEPAGPRRVGEILRHLRSAALYDEQSLSLGPPGALAVRSGVLEIELREEKREVTYLDAVHVVVDGQIVRPTACGAVPTDGDGVEQTYCDADRSFHRIAQGEVLRLRFELPPQTSSDPAAAPALLVASGYYVPLR